MDGSPASPPLSLSRRDALRRIITASALAASLDLTAFAVRACEKLRAGMQDGSIAAPA